MFNIFKSRKFWIVWFSLSVLGAIFSVIYGNYIEQRNKHAKSCTVKLYENKELVFILPNLNNKDKYIEFLSKLETPESWDFPMDVGLPEFQIQVIDTLYEGKLIEFVTRVKRFPLSKGNTLVTRYKWIYSEYVDCDNR